MDNVANDESSTIKFIREDGDSDSANSAAAVTCEYLIKKLGKVGRELADTYSETNQDTAEGFVESLEIVDELMLKMRDIDMAEVSISDRDGFIELLKYLQGKLNRRSKAVSGNDLNM